MRRGIATQPSQSPEPRSGHKKAQRKVPQRDASEERPASPTLAEDKERSDWEGMTPRPEQPSDDVAAPGQVPEDRP
jgi:hypothetical protein